VPDVSITGVGIPVPQSITALSGYRGHPAGRHRRRDRWADVDLVLHGNCVAGLITGHTYRSTAATLPALTRTRRARRHPGSTLPNQRSATV